MPLPDKAFYTVDWTKKYKPIELMKEHQVFSLDKNKKMNDNQIYIFLSIGGNNVRESINNPIQLVVEARNFSNKVSHVIKEIKSNFPKSIYPNLKLF